MAVRHVVMAVHGIGQRMGGRTIVEDAQAVRARINAMHDDHMQDEIGPVSYTHLTLPTTPYV